MPTLSPFIFKLSSKERLRPSNMHFSSSKPVAVAMVKGGPQMLNLGTVYSEEMISHKEKLCKSSDKELTNNYKLIGSSEIGLVMDLWCKGK